MQATTSETHFSRSGYVQKSRDFGTHLIRCRKQHQVPTSHEVGMRENLTHTRSSLRVSHLRKFKVFWKLSGLM